MTTMTSETCTNEPGGAETKEEKARLEAELKVITEKKKAVFETTREADERLRKIREEERQKLERLQEIRREEVEGDLRERHAAPLQAELKATKQETDKLRVELTALKNEHDQLKQKLLTVREEERQNAELRAEMEALKTENNQLRTESDQFQQKISEQNESLINVNAYLRQILVYARNQQFKIRRLQDEILAAKQRSVETQLRQLNELRSPTKETTELKETLTKLQHQQQQQLPATEEHHQGNYCLTWAYVCLLYTSPSPRDRTRSRMPSSA